MIAITGKDAGGNDLVPPDDTLITIAEFENRTEVSLVAEATSILSGSTTVLHITALNQLGQPATGTVENPATVLVQTDDPLATLTVGADSGEELTVTLINGGADVTFTAPEFMSADETRVINVSVKYQPVADLPAISAATAISVNPEGAMILNALVDSVEILSDENTNVTITVTANKEGAVVVGLPIIFQVDTADVERIGFGYRPNLTLFETVNTDVDGLATIIVSSQNDKIRGLATVMISTTDNAEVPPVAVQTEIQLTVDRAPILQSVVWTGSTPAALGVLGSAVASSSTVSFTVYDDLAQPMPNVPVAFDVPATADPGSSVVASALTGANGAVSTVLSAGTHAGPLVVVASASFEGVFITVESPPIPVTGGLATFSQSYMTVEAAEIIFAGAHAAAPTLSLADRFTNIAPAVAVQYRSEAGNITPTTPSGTAAAYTTGGVGPTTPEVRDWSYGIVLPYGSSELQVGVGNYFDPAGCFDSTVYTKCDLLALCTEGDNPYYCPLAIQPNSGEGCWTQYNWQALTALGVPNPYCTTNQGTFQTCETPGIDCVITCSNGEGSITIPGGVINNYLYATNVDIQNLIADYRSRNLSCGFPSACLAGRDDGFAFLTGDECTFAHGCFDFEYYGETKCPHSGLISIVASVRGEESFVDENGNGVFDFNDANTNGLHDLNEETYEDWIDMPEPFLDKNNNCMFDDFNGAIRYEPIEEIQHSDLFSDEDDSTDYGYRDPYDPDDPYRPRWLTNSKWDQDKEIFFGASLLALTGQVDFPFYGELCFPVDVNAGSFTCSNGVITNCIEYGPEFGFAHCIPPKLIDPLLLYDPLAGYNPCDGTNAGNCDTSWIPMDHAYLDGHGNWYNIGFGGTVTVGVQGNLKVFGETSVGLGELYNGMPSDGTGDLVASRPWCQDFPLTVPRLRGGSVPYISSSIHTLCDGAATGPGPHNINLVHSDGAELTLSLLIDIVCPYCGDGILTEAIGEVCDPPVEGICGNDCKPPEEEAVP